ncbi:MAG: cupin domain-containing protein [Deltaproteobacteria bacterium]|nr:cupin domain-containing protein [Deltaproteobacteria bacterium]
MAGKLKGTKETFYDRWVREVEQVPQIEGLFVKDINRVELLPWRRKGGNGIYINLAFQRVDDAHICEIAPAGALNPEKHLFEELILILNGKGATEIWNEGGEKRTFEWQEGSLFAIPLNCWHRHFNGSGSEPVRYLAITDAPFVLNRFRNLEMVFNCSFVFADRYDGSPDYFNAQGKEHSDAILETNFVPDVRTIPLVEDPHIRSHRFRRFLLAGGTMSVHISEIPPGQYRFAHRHGAGAHIIWLDGKGYDLTWETGTDKKHRIDWQAGTLTSPPDWWYHQHFNTGKTPARMLAFHYNIRVSEIKGDFREFVSSNNKKIPFDTEDPEVREAYRRELAKQGLSPNMEEIYRLEREDGSGSALSPKG